MKRISLALAFIVALLFSPAYAQGRTGAVCRDGTTSGATGRGACSHHGGVDHWITSAPEATPTFTPRPTVAPTPTATPSPVPTLTKKTVTIVQPASTVTATVTLTGTSATVLRDANLRAGPGTSYAIIGAAKAGQTVTIIGQNSDASWYHLAGGQWIAAFLVEIAETVSPTTVHVVSSTKLQPTSTVAPITTKVDLQGDPIALSYISGLQSALNFYSEGAQIVNEQTKQASVASSLLLNKFWQDRMITGLTDLKLYGRIVRSLNPPSYLAQVHADMLAIANHLDNAVDFFANGFEHLNVDEIKAGTSEYQLATDAVQTASAKIQAFLTANSSD